MCTVTLDTHGSSFLERRKTYLYGIIFLSSNLLLELRNLTNYSLKTWFSWGREVEKHHQNHHWIQVLSNNQIYWVGIENTHGILILERVSDAT